MAPSAITPPPVEAIPTKGSSRHRVESFDGASVTADELVQSLVRNGGVIIRNLIAPDNLAQITNDIAPHIEGRRNWDGEFFPKQTSRVTGLIPKSRAYADHIVMNHLWQDVTDKLLTSRHEAWGGPEKTHISVSKPQLSATICFSIGPGARAQVLHRDTGNSHFKFPAVSAEEYPLGREDMMGLFVAGKKCTRANGTTRFVPGSHLQNSFDPPPDEKVDPDSTFYAEMEPGDALMMLGSCYHGGSANTTEDEERLIYAAFATKGYLRQEENIYLILDREQVLSYPESYLKHFGYSVSEPYVGHVDFTQPYIYMRDGKPQFTDLSGQIEKA